MTRELPNGLHYAYDWTDAAGELAELRGLTGEALATYCRESVANHDAHTGPDSAWRESLNESDLESLHEWLQGTVFYRLAPAAAVDDAKYALVEYMPACWRSSHVAAGNSGSYPVNGAARVWVAYDFGDDDLDPEWASVIRTAAALPEGEQLSCLPDDAWAPVPKEEP